MALARYRNPMDMKMARIPSIAKWVYNAHSGMGFIHSNPRYFKWCSGCTYSASIQSLVKNRATAMKERAPKMTRKRAADDASTGCFALDAMLSRVLQMLKERVRSIKAMIWD